MTRLRIAGALAAAFAALAFGTRAGAEEPAAVTPADYVARWDFGTGGDASLVPSGGARLGVVLTGPDYAESLMRGGDGKVAEIPKGGFITLSQEANEALKITGSELTFGLRVKCAPDVWNDSPLFSKHGGHGVLAFNLFYQNGAFGAEVGTTKNKGLLSARAPRSEICMPNDPTAWHDVYCRVNSAKMELFVDGRCCDEDFTLGELRTSDVPVAIGAQFDTPDPNAKPRPGFEGAIDFIAVWNRALSDEEIAALSGGPNRIDRRERTERSEPYSMNYWTPPNAYGVGDCMPFCVDGVFHFMYLLDKNRHGAKNGLGAHQWIQATSTDLKNWKHQPFVVPIDDQNEGSICTGSVFYHDGTYYAFYANRAVEYTLPNGETKNVYGLLCVATSQDGIHFEKQEPRPLFLLPDGYGQGTRDPVVFKSPSDGKFHMYITTNYRGKGCWAHAVSDDLKEWSLLDPVYTHKDGEPECPDWFEWGGDYYVIANHLNGFYKKSKNPLGPWEVPDAPNQLMTGAVNVPKTAPWRGGRRIICGWTRERGFGGSAVFHELVRHNDGTLGEKFVPEMIPETGEPAYSEKNVDFSELTSVETPGQFRLRMALTFDPKEIDLLRDVVIQYAPDAQLRVVFSHRAVKLGPYTLERVDFSSGRIELDVIATRNITDVCVNGDRTVTDARTDARPNAIQIVNESPERVAVELLEIAPLRTPCP